MKSLPLAAHLPLHFRDLAKTFLQVGLAILFLLSGAGAVFGAGLLLFCSF